MKTVELWSVDRAATSVAAHGAEPVANTETEQLLEELLVSSPQLLEPGLNLIGRQVPCGGGFLDLLATDRDGRITVFELKRGTLTREAVAQVLDYASDLASLDTERLAKLVEENTGRHGIDRIDDFLDWYTQEYPNASDTLSEVPRMVLVGLGADERARRIVSFLSESGVELHLLTFHAFRVGEQLLLARQVEMTAAPRPPRDSTSGITKEGNREILHAKAAELGVKPLLDRARSFLEEKLEASYCWPGKTAYSFSLEERTSEGRPTLRSYITLYVESGSPPGLRLVFAPRAVEAAGPAVDAFCEAVPSAVRGRNSYSALETRVEDKTWATVSAALEPLCAAIVDGWRRAMEEGDKDASSGVADPM